VLSTRFLADRMKTSPDDAQRVLLDDPSTSKAHVESLPATDRLHLIAFLVARVKAVRRRFVSAQTNPSLVVAVFMCDYFMLWHWHINRSSSGDKVKGISELSTTSLESFFWGRCEIACGTWRQSSPDRLL
jgi:hypothetical protein